MTYKDENEPTFEKGTLIYSDDWSTFLFDSVELLRAHYEAVTMRYCAFDNKDREKAQEIMLSIHSQVRTYVYRHEPIMILDIHDRYYTVLARETIGFIERGKYWRPYVGQAEAEAEGTCLIEIKK
jgi:hypothetical protein